ncbi:nicotinamide mononucleotide permease [Gaeumannomyces tritici R3-111a-1]|uniref:Nicotinamide mononucleotide permease n=1 Tax=Gaeumannomyces tritici (strain R3-111a-1) TaxID=644352 RepID=J3NWZ1_GAET3|nr:nicotinamide mononucleotide permease [Gaeumannomyces tritici R3-111a-1]EJT75873.1 nicotinamide mononucleotide permease [Gaeumannomyces tritici R3-111a-1]
MAERTSDSDVNRTPAAPSPHNADSDRAPPSSLDEEARVVGPPQTAGYVAKSKEEEALVRKIDCYLLPTIWIMYLCSYMDRTNIGNAKIAGMTQDLEMDSDMYSTALVVFFVGYVVFEVPSNMALSRTRPSVFLPTIMFLWGVLTTAMGFVPTYGALVGLRAAIGALEAGFAPGILLLFNSWYRIEEQSVRFAVYISAAILSGAFGGLLAGGIVTGLDGLAGIEGWRWLFIIEGIATVCVASASRFILLDFPANTKRLSERERVLAVKRLGADTPGGEKREMALMAPPPSSSAPAATLLTSNSHMSASRRMKTPPPSGIKPSPSHIRALKMVLKEWRTWLLVLGYMAIVGSSTLSYFYPTLVQGLGYTSVQMAQYMVVPIYGSAFVATVCVGWVADRHLRRRRPILAAACMTLATACALAVVGCAHASPGAAFAGRYALLVVMASALWAANALALSIASITFLAAFPGEDGVGPRAVGLALVNAMGNLAQIYGAYLFPSEDAPGYLLGFGVIAGMCFVGLSAFASLEVLLRKRPGAAK